MHIIYIHQHFATPKGSTGTRSYEFARRWVKAGHKVTVITGHYDIGGLELQRGLIRKQILEGIDVVIVGTRYSNKQSFLRRISSFVSFMLFSSYAGLMTEKVDVIYATSTPLTVGVPAVVLNCLKRIPFVFEVRDQWPEIPIEMGIIKNKSVIRFLLWLERIIYERSAAVVALSPGMADGIRSVVGERKNITVIPNSSDKEIFRPDIDGSTVRKERGWNNKLVLLHFGAVGKANGLQFLVDVADRLKEFHDIHFALIGDGSEKTTLVERAARKGLKNIEFLNSVPKTNLPEIIAACDAALVIFANYPILEHNSANKFFDSLSAGKPVLLNYSGWQRAILEQHNAGFGCQLCNIDEFVEKVLYLNSHRGRLANMGHNARRLATEKFDRDVLASQVLEVLELTVEEQSAFGVDANG